MSQLSLFDAPIQPPATAIPRATRRSQVVPVSPPSKPQPAAVPAKPPIQKQAASGLRVGHAVELSDGRLGIVKSIHEWYCLVDVGSGEPVVAMPEYLKSINRVKGTYFENEEFTPLTSRIGRVVCGRNRDRIYTVFGLDSEEEAKQFAAHIFQKQEYWNPPEKKKPSRFNHIQEGCWTQSNWEVHSWGLREAIIEKLVKELS